MSLEKESTMTTSAEKRITNTLDLIEALEEERDHIDSQVEDLKRESKELDRVIMVHCEKLRELSGKDCDCLAMGIKCDGHTRVPA